MPRTAHRAPRPGSSRRLRPLVLLGLLAVLGASLGAAAATLVSCPLGTPGGDPLSQPFYVSSFPGSSVAQVTLFFSARTAGTYTFSLTIRLNAYDGTILGAANATAVLTGDDTANVATTFSFASAVVPAGGTIAFVPALVSGPAGPVFYGVITSAAGCAAVQTESAAPPLSSYRRHGVAVIVTGTAGTVRLSTLTVPANASIHGQNGTFFHSDLWVMNRSYQNTAGVIARYRCFAGQSCGDVQIFTLAPRQSRLYADVVTELFGAPETAGAIEILFDAAQTELSASARVYTPTLPSPTNGTGVPALAASEARGRSLFLGLSNNGGSLTSGFRSNAGVYNPNGASVGVVFTLHDANGRQLGTPYMVTAGPNQALQVNDIFGATGAGTFVGRSAYLVVTTTAFDSAAPIFPYVTVIDNQSGDSVWVLPSPDEGS